MNNLKYNIVKNISEKKKNILKGGKYLGEGSYGCVITPSLTCKKSGKTFGKSSRKSTTKQTHTQTHARKLGNLNSISNSNSNSNKTVSKIVLSPDNSIKDEISISNKLKSIDPQQKYFITINEYCQIKNVPIDRSNIAKVKYLNNSGDSYQKLEKKILDKKYCPIDLSVKPINLIMPNGGYDLMEIANVINHYGLYKSKKTKSKDKSKDKEIDNSTRHKIKTTQMLFDNLKECIKNLLQGLLKMHQHRIVNRDIKEENIMANYNEEKKRIEIRFIDYGLSEILTPEYCKHYSNIILQGTYVLIAPEIFIIYYINKYSRYNDEYIMDKINKDISAYVKKMLRDLKIDTSEVNNIVRKLFDEIKTLFDNRKILDKYFGVSENLNGYLQKNDVYSLGMTIYEFLDLYTNVIDIKKNLRLYDLLKNMINLDPNARYNTLQCLQHPYFK